MKISKITIGRLYNLGNYEHVRYELSVDVPSGESAGQALSDAVRVLHALKPVKTGYDVTSAQLALRKAPVDETTMLQVERDNLAEARKKVFDHQRKLDRQKSALKLMDELGGTRIKTDAKLNWDDDNYSDDY